VANWCKLVIWLPSSPNLPPICVGPCLFWGGLRTRISSPVLSNFDPRKIPATEGPEGWTHPAKVQRKRRQWKHGEKNGEVAEKNDVFSSMGRSSGKRLHETMVFTSIISVVTYFLGCFSFTTWVRSRNIIYWDLKNPASWGQVILTHNHIELRLNGINLANFGSLTQTCMKVWQENWAIVSLAWRKTLAPFLNVANRIKHKSQHYHKWDKWNLSPKDRSTIGFPTSCDHHVVL
jgi:hypothetical protein